MQTLESPGMSSALEQALAIVMSENACDLDAAMCSLAGSAVSQRLPMDEVATAIVDMARRSAG